MSDIEKKELNEEELDQVAGGAGESSLKLDNHTFTGHVNKYNIQADHRYWFVADDHSSYVRANVIKSYELDNEVWFFTLGTIRVHEVTNIFFVEGGKPYEFEGYCVIKGNSYGGVRLSGDKVTAFLYRDGVEA